jgi:hypothetical protein
MYLRINYKIFIIILIAFVSCNQEKAWDCAKTKGSQTTEVRHLGAFKSIFLFDKIQYNLIQDSINYLEVTTGKNILSNVKSEINNDQLSISLKHSCELFRKSDEIAKVDIHFNNVRSLQIFNSQLVKSNTFINVEEFYISKRSNGNLDLKLNAKTAFIYSNEYGDTKLIGRINNMSTEQVGVGQIDLSNAIIEKAQVFINGPGETLIRCKKTLEANIRESGTLTIFGKPDSTSINLEGAGKVVYLP